MIPMVPMMDLRLKGAFGLTGKVEGAWMSRRRKKEGLRDSRVELNELWFVLEDVADFVLKSPGDDIFSEVRGCCQRSNKDVDVALQHHDGHLRCSKSSVPHSSVRIMI
jgi:hypothetical protein